MQPIMGPSGRSRALDAALPVFSAVFLCLSAFSYAASEQACLWYPVVSRTVYHIAASLSVLAAAVACLVAPALFPAWYAASGRSVAITLYLAIYKADLAVIKSTAIVDGACSEGRLPLLGVTPALDWVRRVCTM